jgi:hypothetical protein
MFKQGSFYSLSPSAVIPDGRRPIRDRREVLIGTFA